MLYLIYLMNINKNMTIESRNQFVIKCTNKNCGYVWKYKGKFLIYATCPSCRHNVKIKENILKDSKDPTNTQIYEEKALEHTGGITNPCH